MEEHDCADVLRFWEALHVQSLTRQLVSTLSTLEDALPELHDRVHGIRTFLADGLDEAQHPDAARVLRDNEHVKLAEVAQVDAELKRRSIEAARRQGMSLSEAIRAFLREPAKEP